MITYAPGGGYSILFGTGKYVEKADTNPAWFTGNSFYAFHDQANQAVGSRSDLASRALTAAFAQGKAGYRITGIDFNYGDGDGAVKTKKGWFIDFPDSIATGERMISEATVAFGSIFFNTFAPGSTCQKPGSGRSYKLDLLSGKTAGPDSVTAIRSPDTARGIPLLIHTKFDLGIRDALGQRTATYYFSLLNFNADSDTHGVLPSDQAVLKSGRQSWRELSVPGM